MEKVFILIIALRSFFGKVCRVETSLEMGKSYEVEPGEASKYVSEGWAKKGEKSPVTNDKATKEAAEKAKKEAAENSKKEAAEKAKKEADDKAAKDAEEKAKKEAAELAELIAAEEAEKAKKAAETGNV